MCDDANFVQPFINRLILPLLHGRKLQTPSVTIPTSIAVFTQLVDDFSRTLDTCLGQAQIEDELKSGF